jgi:hypothetical protein
MATVDEDLGQLEKDIRTLRIEFEQYFGGGRKRPPNDTQWRVESLLKRYAEQAARLNFTQRFRYTNIAQSYAKYSDVWRKRLKEREEGTGPRHFGAAARAIEAERAKSHPKPETHRETGFATSFSDPDRETHKVEQLYRKLIEARKASGESSGAPSFEDFGKFVRQKTKELKTKKGASLVEYTVSVEDGRVKLKARVSS